MVAVGGGVQWRRQRLMKATQQLAGRTTRGREDERAAHQEATQQPAGARQRVGGAVRGRQEEERRVAQREATQQPDGAMRRQEGGAVRGQQEDERVAWREAMQQPACVIRPREGGAVRGRREDERRGDATTSLRD